MRVALCDDETDENRRLKALIDGYALDTGADLTCECFTDPAGLLSKDRYDLYFLDYIMPAMTGSELAVKLREKFGGAVTVCFLTSYEKAAVDVINRNIDAQAFLLKPVEKAKLTALLEKLSERSDLKRLVLKKDQTMTVVYPRDILYVEARDKKCLFRFSDRSEEFPYKITELEEQYLPESFFFRVHRSYLVNMSYVTAYDKKTVTVSSGEVIPLRRTREFEKAFSEFILNSHE